MLPRFFESPRYTTAQNAGLLTIRAMLATVFIFHGAQKLFGVFGGYGIQGTAGFLESIGVPFPVASAVLAGSAEFFGGLALALGVLTRLATVPMAFTMLVAIVTVHPSGFDARSNGMEYPLTLMAMLIGLGLTGAGDWTLATLFRRARLAGSDTATAAALAPGS